MFREALEQEDLCFWLLEMRTLERRGCQPLVDYGNHHQGVLVAPVALAASALSTANPSPVPPIHPPVPSN
ncbi:MAG: hypothetical protein BWY63_03798 [Chloroflexi bacterium ADurb.Bin360]|nr:MAG: hypothetical protein BWY63_03798 [Chloroflexi bacterium ADurb.Bin360]